MPNNPASSPPSPPPEFSIKSLASNIERMLDLQEERLDHAYHGTGEGADAGQASSSAGCSTPSTPSYDSSVEWASLKEAVRRQLQELDKKHTLPVGFVRISVEGPDWYAVMLRQIRERKEETYEAIKGQIAGRKNEVSTFLAGVASGKDGPLSSKSFRLGGILIQLTPWESDMLNLLWADGAFPRFTLAELHRSIYPPGGAAMQSSLKRKVRTLKAKVFRSTRGKWSINTSEHIFLSCPELKRTK
jgi:hypothetical protein